MRIHQPSAGNWGPTATVKVGAARAPKLTLNKKEHKNRRKQVRKVAGTGALFIAVFKATYQSNQRKVFFNRDCPFGREGMARAVESQF